MIAVIFSAVLIFILAVISIKVVREYKRLVVFRLGKCIGEKGPGLVWLWPIIDKAIWVDLREFYLDIPKQTCITKDNAPIDIDFLIYMKVFNAVFSVIRIQDFVGAAQGIATTTLRAVVGDILLDDVLAKREQINKVLRTKLDEVTERWGVKVSSVEIREILPPKDVQDAMTKQMAAERSRRAVVTEADGKREAAIKVAEGEKQAAILKAEGDRQASILRAEGFALALDKIFSIAKNIDTNTMTLQYLETLKSIGSSPSTKYIFPLEFTNLLKPLLNYTTKSNQKDNDSSTNKML
jgi:regulator of protease activity HflC (stomatin/prohibitin superfamily)